MVIATIPRIRLVTESIKGPPGVWRFQLTELDDEYHLEISEVENLACEEQLGLLALIRGLESIERHSEIDLITSSRYVEQGMAYGMDEWRENNWRWERFGRLVPIKHLELWKRVDRALQYHRLTSVELIHTKHSSASIAMDNASPVTRPLGTRRTTSAGSIRLHRLSITPAVIYSERSGIVAKISPLPTAADGWHHAEDAQYSAMRK